MHNLTPTTHVTVIPSFARRTFRGSRKATPCFKSLGLRGSFLIALLLSTLNFQPPLLAQGGITPTLPPGPTMKTLDQVEARTPIDAAHTPGDGTNEFIIDQAGSYYLTGNLKVFTDNGIHITAAGVTVDLNGFQIARASGSGSGILVDALADNCAIRNGSVTGFVFGIGAPISRGGAISHVIASNCSLGLSAGRGWQIESCNAHDNLGDGIQTSEGCTVRSSSSSKNGGIGFNIGHGSSILGCSASENQGMTAATAGGISTGDGCTIAHCTARSNTSPFSLSAGIITGFSATITDCSATFNTNTNASPTGSTGAGIIPGRHSKVQNCSVSNNKGDGITATGECTIVANVCSFNGSSTSGAGVHVVGSANRVEGNNVTKNGRGIDVDTSGNLIIKNSASGSTGTGTPSANYDIVAANFVGTIVTTEAAMNSATSSNINISY